MANKVDDSVFFGNGFARIALNPKIYPVAVVLSAAYSLLDRGYFLVSGSPERELAVEIRSKGKPSKEALQALCDSFSDELVNSAIYAIQSANNRPLREAILRAAFFSNSAEADAGSKKAVAGADSGEFDVAEIAKPWTPDKRPK